MNNPSQNATKEQKDQGYMICTKCRVNVHLLQAGFDCKHVICKQCGASVCDKNEFFGENKINIV